MIVGDDDGLADVMVCFFYCLHKYVIWHVVVCACAVGWLGACRTSFVLPGRVILRNLACVTAGLDCRPAIVLCWYFESYQSTQLASRITATEKSTCEVPYVSVFVTAVMVLG